MLARRTPMKRSGFKRRVPECAPRERAAAPRYAPIPADIRARVRMVPATDEVRAVPKTHERRNARLLDMARDRPCLFRVPGICNYDPATTVACHSNSSTHGKAGARKADDHWSAWGCFACHAWLDQGRADAREKLAAFLNAHQRQVNEWTCITSNPAEKEADRRAAQWALDRIAEGVPRSLAEAFA